jgi:hypothetical protein
MLPCCNVRHVPPRYVHVTRGSLSDCKVLGSVLGLCDTVPYRMYRTVLNAVYTAFTIFSRNRTVLGPYYSTAPISLGRAKTLLYHPPEQRFQASVTSSTVKKTIDMVGEVAYSQERLKRRAGPSIRSRKVPRWRFNAYVEATRPPHDTCCSPYDCSLARA